MGNRISGRGQQSQRYGNNSSRTANTQNTTQSQNVNIRQSTQRTNTPSMRPATGAVRCPRCRRLLQPPPGHPRFLCPCGQMLMSPQASATPARVRCPYCRLLLAPPPGAPIFRCPCGHHLRAPAVSNTQMNTNASSGPGQSNEVIEAVARLLKRQGNKQWAKKAGKDNTLTWIRLLSSEEEEEWRKKEIKLYESLKDSNFVTKLSVKEMKIKLHIMGINVNSGLEKVDLQNMLLSATDTLVGFGKARLKHLLEKVNADYSNCETETDYATRLFVIAWYGKSKDDAWVRDFGPGTKLNWVPASKYVLNFTTMGGGITSSEVEAVSSQPFAAKLKWFKEKQAERRVKWEEGHVRIRIRRDHLLVDSFNSISKLQPKDMMRFFRFEFIGEPGVDAGGVAREWFQLVTDFCFNVDFGLFEYSGVDNICYQINPSSGIANELHLQYYRFLGRVLGKALFDGHVIGAHVTQPLYKHILGWPIQRKDLEFVDSQLASSMNDILECDDASQLYLDFTTAVRVFGETTTIDLKPHGSDIDVTNKNREEYVSLMLKHIMLGRINDQLREMLIGFYEVIPQAQLSVFDFQELELLLCGLPNIDVDDWIKNTKYRGVYAKTNGNHKVVHWFWEVIRESTEEQKARFLQFATGTSRVPVQGFSALQGNDGNIKLFTIDSVPYDQSVFPKAHTCFNRIELPIYPSKTDLKKFLHQATQMEIVGFGIE